MRKSPRLPLFRTVNVETAKGVLRLANLILPRRRDGFVSLHCRIGGEGSFGAIAKSCLSTGVACQRLGPILQRASGTGPFSRAT